MSLRSIGCVVVLGEQLDIACGRDRNVGGADQPPETDREFHDRAHVGFAFALIGIEQSVRRTLVDDRSQLPREVGGVTHARAHTLAEERWHLMRRVTGQEQTTGAALSCSGCGSSADRAQDMRIM